MKQTIQAILFGFRELLRWDIMKYVLISGFIVTAVWVGIGTMLWESLIETVQNFVSPDR